MSRYGDLSFNHIDTGLQHLIYRNHKKNVTEQNFVDFFVLRFRENLI